MIGIHSPALASKPAPTASGSTRLTRRGAVRADERLEITYPVLLDPDLEMWQVYENQGWPARYLFDGRGSLFDYHYGEGAYTETELAIRNCSGRRARAAAAAASGG